MEPEIELTARPSPAHRRGRCGLAVTAAAGLPLLLLAPALAAAKTVHLKATLTPVHGVAAGPHGTLKGRYDTAKQVFHWTVTFRHLTGQAIAVRCLRQGKGAGKGATASAVALHLTTPPPHPLPYAPVTGKTALRAPQAKQLLGGHWRVVVSTVHHRRGEIAGTIHKG